MLLMRVLRSWGLVLALAAAVAGVVILASRRTDVVEVRVAAVARGLVERTVAGTKAGAIRSKRVSDLSVETAGTIVAVHAREGKKVAIGDLLISIDRREADALLAGAEAELQALEAVIVEADARRRDAARSLARSEELYAEGVASESQRDEARLLAQATEAAHAAAEARRSVQRAVVRRLGIAAAKCELRAPFAGTVTELFVEVGEWAIPGKVGLRLLDPDLLYVRAELDEIDIGPIREGLPARIMLDPYRDRRLAGRVSRVSPFVSEVEEQNRTLEVEVEWSGGTEGLQLKPGTSADVEVVLESLPDVIRIPASALMEGDRVFVVSPEGKAATVSVRVGLRNWEFAQVLDGLREGDVVIVSLESEKLKEGVRVRVVGKAGP
jgi:HlyD family secretion protein